MTVYKVIEDVNNFRCLLPEDESAWASAMLTFDCLPKGNAWKAPKMRCPNPKLKPGHFWSLMGIGAFILTAHATDKLRTQLEIAGELLELPYKDDMFYAINVLQCADCLDQEATVFRRTADGKILTSWIDKYVFNSKWIPESSIFKIPETSRGSIYVCEGRIDPEDEFKWIVEHEGLTGLKFQEVWQG